MSHVTEEQRQTAVLAKLVWASIGAGVDAGLSDEQLIHAFQPDMVRKVADLARKSKRREPASSEA